MPAFLIKRGDGPEGLRIHSCYIIAKIWLYGGPLWTVPELLFEGKKFITALQQLLIADHS
jgi:hypothetical protein